MSSRLSTTGLPGSTASLTALASALVLAAIACGDAAPEPEPDGPPSSSCDGGQASACHSQCSDTEPCAAGSHCELGACIADCTDDSDCSGTDVCGADHHCRPGCRADVDCSETQRCDPSGRCRALGKIVSFDVATKVGPQVARWGWDLKGAQGLTSTPSRAATLYAQTPANLIRIPIFAKAHHSDGSVVTSAYAKVLTSLREVKAINPAIEVFASLKLDGADTFVGPPDEPDWLVKGTASWPLDTSGKIFSHSVSKPNPRFYARLVADYFDYMRAEGVTIDYLGLNNESQRALDAPRYADTVDRLEVLLAARGHDLTALRLVASDAFAPQGNVSALEALATLDRLDTVNIIGSHVYPDTAGHLASLWGDMQAIAGPLEMWHTEVHMGSNSNSSSFVAEENISRLRAGMAVLFAANLHGVSTFVWWAGGTETDKINKVLKVALVESMVAATPIQSPAFHDQETDPLAPLYQGYRRGDELTLWLANPGAAQTDLALQLAGGTIDTATAPTSHYWAGPGDVITDANSGALELETRPDRHTIVVRALPANSIGWVRVQLEPN